MSTVLKQLEDLTGVTYTGTEAQDFLNSMIRAVNDLSEEDWNKLPAEGQQWFNDAAKVISEDDDAEIPSIKGMEEVKEPKKEEKKDDKPEKKKEKEKVKKDPEPAKKGESEESEDEPEKKEPKKRRVGPSAGSIVRSILLDNKDLSLDEVMEELKTRDVDMKRSSAQVIYQGTTRTIEAIIEHGDVKGKDGKVVVSKAG